MFLHDWFYSVSLQLSTKAATIRRHLGDLNFLRRIHAQVKALDASSDILRSRQINETLHGLREVTFMISRLEIKRTRVQHCDVS